jgi:hypothetical protein
LLENYSHSHELFASDSVVLELSAPTYPRRNEALALASTYNRLPSTPQANALARVFVDHRVMPRNLAGDALHVAIATLAQMDVLLTWNVAHLANENKRRHLQVVCLQYGCLPPRLRRPDVFIQEQYP